MAVTAGPGCGEMGLWELSLIMTGRGLEAFQKILRKFQTPIYPADKNSNPIKISKNDFRPQQTITERKHHILVPNDLPLSGDRLRSVSVSVVYTSSRDSGQKKV